MIRADDVLNRARFMVRNYEVDSEHEAVIRSIVEEVNAELETIRCEFLDQLAADECELRALVRDEERDARQELA